jgi:peptidylprolyl isomerase
MKTFKALFLFLFPFITLLAQEPVMSKETSVVVVFETNYGNIELTLRPDIAPKTCENFVGLVNKHYYDGVVFHRIIKNFMIQGGDPTATGAGGNSIWNGPFLDEFRPNVQFDKVGVLAMANRGPNTNTSQFFITTAMTPWLNQKHTIFGYVTAGYDIVQKIESTPVDPSSRPLQPVKIVKAYIK